MGWTFSLADMINTNDSIPTNALLLTTAGSAAGPNLFLNMLPVQLMDPVWILSEAGHWACIFRGLLGGTPVQTNVMCCLCLSLGNLIEAQSDPQFFVCLCWAWVFMGKTKLCTKISFHQHCVQRQIIESPQAP